ncbi:unnamed protein product [Closterium sp. Yama58-4]|nr:unnamed protein product [Closterium sp. Yama58-4]
MSASPAPPLSINSEVGAKSRFYSMAPVTVTRPPVSVTHSPVTATCRPPQNSEKIYTGGEWRGDCEEPPPTPAAWWDEQCSVEQLALQHYASEEGGGWKGVHCEGSLWSTLFVLLFWDVIFAPVPDAFHHPFQTAPLDFGSPLFASTRLPLVRARLEELIGGQCTGECMREGGGGGGEGGEGGEVRERGEGGEGGQGGEGGEGGDGGVGGYEGGKMNDGACHVGGTPVGGTPVGGTPVGGTPRTTTPGACPAASKYGTCAAGGTLFTVKLLRERWHEHHGTLCVGLGLLNEGVAAENVYGGRAGEGDSGRNGGAAAAAAAATPASVP